MACVDQIRFRLNRFPASDSGQSPACFEAAREGEDTDSDSCLRYRQLGAGRHAVMGNNKTDGETERVSSSSGSGPGLEDSKSRLRRDEAKPRVISLVVRLEKQPSSTYSLRRMRWTFACCLRHVPSDHKHVCSSSGQSHDPRETCHSMPVALRTRVPHSPRRTTVAFVFSRRRLVSSQTGIRPPSRT